MLESEGELTTLEVNHTGSIISLMWGETCSQMEVYIHEGVLPVSSAENLHLQLEGCCQSGQWIT